MPGCKGRGSEPKPGSDVSPAERAQLLEELVQRVAAGDGELLHRLGQRLRRQHSQGAPVDLTYAGLHVTTQALVGDAGISTLLSGPMNLLRRLIRAPKNERELAILDNVNGVLKPGRFTLLLGPPSCGKSTLLSILSGRLNNDTLKVKGQVSYGGHPQSKASVQRMAAYAAQVDNHNPYFTVRETLQFAYACQAGVKGQKFRIPAGLHTFESSLRVAENPRGEVPVAAGHPPRNQPPRGCLARGIPLGAELHPAGDGLSTVEDGGAARAHSTAGYRSPEEAGDGHVDKTGGPAEQSDGIESRHAGACRGEPHGAASSSTHVDQGPRPGQRGRQARPSEAGSPTNGVSGSGNAEAALANEHASSYTKPGSSIEPSKDDRSPTDELLEEVWGSDAKVDLVLSLIGLSHCQDTPVGSALVRGISGGEKRRLTISESILGPRAVWMLDEISTGLDSATLYSMVKSLAQIVHAFEKTCMVSMLQPPPEVLALFDDVILITEGKIVYHGPVDHVVQFFEDMGIICPPRKDPASFMLEATTAQGQHKYASSALIAEKGSEAFRSEDAMISISFIERKFWEENEHGLRIKKELAMVQEKAARSHEGSAEHDTCDGEHYPLTPFEAVLLAVRRQLTLIFRDKVLMRARFIQIAVLGSIMGSLFFDLSTDSMTAARSFFGASFMTVLFLTFGGFPHASATVEMKKVWYKQRDDSYLPAYAQGVALYLSQVPFLMAEVAMFSCILYPMVGFYLDAAHFFTFYVIALGTSLCVSAVFRFLAVATPNPMYLSAVVGISFVLLIVTSGFVILRENIPPWMIWAYYTSPFAYSLRSLCMNEMRAPVWQEQQSPTNPDVPLGDEALLAFSFFTSEIWIWIGVIFLFGASLILAMLTTFGLRYTNPEVKQATVPDQEQVSAALAAAESRRKALSRIRSEATLLTPAASRKALMPTFSFMNVSSLTRASKPVPTPRASNSSKQGLRAVSPSRLGSPNQGSSHHMLCPPSGSKLESYSQGSSPGQPEEDGMAGHVVQLQGGQGMEAHSANRLTGLKPIDAIIKSVTDASRSAKSTFDADHHFAPDLRGPTATCGAYDNRDCGSSSVMGTDNSGLSASSGVQSSRIQGSDGGFGQRTTATGMAEYAGSSYGSGSLEQDRSNANSCMSNAQLMHLHKEGQQEDCKASQRSSTIAGKSTPITGTSTPMTERSSPSGAIARPTPLSPLPTTLHHKGVPSTRSHEALDIAHILPFKRISLVFKDIRYYVPNPAYHQSIPSLASKALKHAKQAFNGVTCQLGSCSRRRDVNEHDVEKALEPDCPPGVALGLVPAPSPSPAPTPLSEAKELELLKGISGYTEPGVLTALMGGSGAGKTTLMDVIAGRKTVGRIEGQILVNGHPKVQTSWARVMGYCEQNDIHSASTTIREAVLISALLRLPGGMSDAQMEAYVDEVLDIVNLMDIMFSIVGILGESGLSLEQRKRLTIAVELVSNPSVIFMDEPTSGLDARSAVAVMRAVRNVAYNGRSVVVTIHQPSIEIFESFDMLLLIQRGGMMAFFGPLGERSSLLVKYLSAVPGSAALQAGVNPATWMLQVTGGSMTGAGQGLRTDWPELYKKSEVFKKCCEHADMVVERDSEMSTPLTMSSQYAKPFSMQFRYLLGKLLRMYWRTPSYNTLRIALSLFVALITYGVTYFQVAKFNSSEPMSVGDVQNSMGIMFSSSNFLGMMNMNSMMALIGSEHRVFDREQASRMYDAFAYGAAIAIVEVPYLLLQTILFVPTMYFMVRFEATAEKFFHYFIMFFETLFFYTVFGQFIVYITPNQGFAQVLAAGTNFLFNIFNGFVIPFPDIPAGWKWMNRVAPATWVLYGLGSAQLGDRQNPIVVNGETTTVAAFMTDYFGYEYSMRWWCVAIMLAYIIFLRVASIMALKYLTFVKR